MGNSTDNQEEAEIQPDEIPKDTQINNQYIESPSSPENQQNQLNQMNIQTGEQIAVNQGEEYQNNNQTDFQNQFQKETQENNLDNRRVDYEINQENLKKEDNQEQINQEQYNQNNLEYQNNKEYEEDNQIDEENQRYEGMEANEENDNKDININNHNQDNFERQEIQDNEEENENNIYKQNRSYKINKNGNIYQVKEGSQQYQVNSGDKKYHIKKEYKTTKIEKDYQNSENYPNNIYSEGKKSKIISQEKKSVKNKKIKIIQKDNMPELYIQTSGYYDSPIGNKYSRYYSDIPRYLSFQRSARKNNPKIHSSVNIVKTEKSSKLVEIPRTEYGSFTGRETIFIGGGIDTGEYKFRGQGIIITQTEIPKGKIVISEEEILKEINKRKNKKKREKKKNYDILDKFYCSIEFDGIPIKKIEKIEQQQKQYEYEEQQKYYSLSKGNADYQYSSKESQSHQTQSNNQSKQFDFQQSQFKSQQSQSQAKSGILFRQMNENQNKNDINSSNIKFKNLGVFSPSDNFSKYLLQQINKIRTEPQSFIGIIEDAKKNIIKNKNGHLIYNGKIKIGLINGQKAFDNAINYLKKVKPMEKLIFNPYITVQLPRTESEIKYKNDLRLKVENMVNDGISIKSYWRDVIKDPELSFLMMIVDDNGGQSGMRRKDLLDPNMKYIGINSIDINGTFVCYLTLSNE